jgi:hypothetical protein
MEKRDRRDRRERKKNREREKRHKKNLRNQICLIRRLKSKCAKRMFVTKNALLPLFRLSPLLLQIATINI